MDAEETVALAMARHLELPYASARNRVLRMELGQGLERLIPRDFAAEKAVLPLFIDGGTLAVATPHCDDPELLRELSVRSSLKVSPFVAARSQVLRAIDESYR